MDQWRNRRTKLFSLKQGMHIPALVVSDGHLNLLHGYENVEGCVGPSMEGQFWSRMFRHLSREPNKIVQFYARNTYTKDTVYFASVIRKNGIPIRFSDWFGA